MDGAAAWRRLSSLCDARPHGRSDGNRGILCHCLFTSALHRLESLRHDSGPCDRCAHRQRDGTPQPQTRSKLKDAHLVRFSEQKS